MSIPSVWLFEEDVHTSYEFGERLLRDAALGVTNTKELADAKYSIAVARGGVDEALPLPDDFPAPRLGLAKGNFAPDYFHFGKYHFCSRKLRDAIAQPGKVVEYRPVQLTGDSPNVLAQDYRWMRVLAGQPAMEIRLSDCEVEQITSRISGKTITVATNIDRLVLPPDFVPVTEIFRVAETLGTEMVTDALAERVLRAGCTGMEFRHPGDERWGKHIVHFRTIEGVGERRVGFPDSRPPITP